MWHTDVRFEQFWPKMDLEQSEMFDEAIQKILVGWISYFLVLLLTVRENPDYRPLLCEITDVSVSFSHV